MKKDLQALCAVPTKSLDVGVKTASANGASADLRGFHSCLVIVDSDLWTDGTHTISLEDSDDNAAFTAVPASNIIGSTPVIDGATKDDQAYKFGYSGGKRYLRVITTVAGATTGAIYGSMIVPGHERAGGKLVK